jgi:hypothetical protein
MAANATAAAIPSVSGTTVRGSFHAQSITSATPTTSTMYVSFTEMYKGTSSPECWTGVSPPVLLGVQNGHLTDRTWKTVARQNTGEVKVADVALVD